MNQAALFAQALARLEPATRDAFLAAIRKTRSAAQLHLVIEHLKAGNIEAAIAATTFPSSFFFPLDKAVQDAFQVGAGLAMKEMGSLPPDPFSGSSISIAFDGRHPRAELWTQTASSALITDVTEDQKAMARTVIETGLAKGKGITEIARGLIGTAKPGTKARTGGFIGITQQQAQFALNMEDELNGQNMANYFNRARRDKRYDKLVYRAMETGQPIPAAKIEEIVGRYKDQLLALRGQTIARTETLSALGAGRHEGYKQLLDSGAVHDSQIKRTWDATLDKRTRLDHMIMNGKTVQGMEEPFVIPAGVHGPESRLMFPRDRSLEAPARETINCRCFETIEIDYLNGPGAANG